jgi:hypothetical protein
MLTNAMSLGPKIDEIQLFILGSDLDLISITETWLRNTNSNNVIRLRNTNSNNVIRVYS